MTRNRILPAMVVAVAALVGIGPGACSIEAAQLERFVDFDGDGFNDNAPDTDRDGIPDEIEFHSFFSTQKNLILSVTQMSTGTKPSPEPRPCAAERFGAREFATRGISAVRTDFDAGFGSDLGLGGGLGAGGACSGGICF